MIDAAKISDTAEDIKFTGKETNYTFNVAELKVLAMEINEMSVEGKAIDLDKAIHNARYFAEIDRRIAEVKSGRWTQHELIEVENA
ncbi:MAG: hypothetical protein IJU91_07940 [Selenomonadaceae bacterium]|nr:hypothetical protein [Selenomonadaceae bacterium]